MAAPPTATAESHAELRDRFKACALGVQYGISAERLARLIVRPVPHAGESGIRGEEFVDGLNDAGVRGVVVVEDDETAFGDEWHEAADVACDGGVGVIAVDVQNVDGFAPGNRAGVGAHEADDIGEAVGLEPALRFGLGVERLTPGRCAREKIDGIDARDAARHAGLGQDDRR